MRIRFFLLATTLAATALTPASAQRRQPTPEQRIDRLERGLYQMQKKVFPKGAPADSVGYSDDPAVTESSLQTLYTRLDAIERRMADIARTSEENSNRVATMEVEMARLRAQLDRRPPPSDDPAATDDSGSDPSFDDNGPPPAPRPRVEAARNDPPPPIRAMSPSDPAFTAAGEEAYDQGYQLWLQKKYDQSITTLRAMASSFPGHRRVSWANNLAGRALLDKGEYRAAAEALLANYRNDPQGERAADSLFYLGQASFKLGQPQQACKAYGELENVYGSSMRAELRRLLPAAKSQAKCG